MQALQCIPNCLECGTDEAGRGCLAGPVTAAAVILKPNFKSEILNDSKQISMKVRGQLRVLIEKEALSFGVVHVRNEEIDEVNILNASNRAMQRAIKKLDPPPEHIAVDGNQFKSMQDIPHRCVVKGDATYMNIAAASVLAKTHRDERMAELHKEFPDYRWKKNKGYPTKGHRDAIREIGVSAYHRKSFQLLPKQYKLNL